MTEASAKIFESFAGGCRAWVWVAPGAGSGGVCAGVLSQASVFIELS